jgi:hypothetical protein
LKIDRVRDCERGGADGDARRGRIFERNLQPKSNDASRPAPPKTARDIFKTRSHDFANEEFLDGVQTSEQTHLNSCNPLKINMRYGLNSETSGVLFPLSVPSVLLLFKIPIFSAGVSWAVRKRISISWSFCAGIKCVCLGVALDRVVFSFVILAFFRGNSSSVAAPPRRDFCVFAATSPGLPDL